MARITYPKRNGGLLRLARREQGLTVQEVAERAGVTPSRISQVERAEIEGTLQLDTLDRFATALGYQLRYELVPDGEERADVPVDLGEPGVRNDLDAHGCQPTTRGCRWVSAGSAASKPPSGPSASDWLPETSVQWTISSRPSA